MHGRYSVTTKGPREQQDLVRCNICEMKVSAVAVVKHLHTAYHELRKVDLEKELSRLKTTECYEKNRSVISMW
jgi:hypothetical protein